MSVRRSIVLATANPGKAAELRILLKDSVAVLSLLEVEVEMPEETGVTHRENAELKAMAVAMQSGMTTLADDSGLAVDALGGLPGVRSARYAGLQASDAENREKLLAELRGVSAENRTARFVCALSLATPHGPVCSSNGVLEGRIADRDRGASGFGYDRIFEIDGGRTLAELPSADKNALSHRAQALRAILPCIDRMLRTGPPSLHSPSSRIDRP